MIQITYVHMVRVAEFRGESFMLTSFPRKPWYLLRYITSYQGKVTSRGPSVQSQLPLPRSTNYGLVRFFGSLQLLCLASVSAMHMH